MSEYLHPAAAAAIDSQMQSRALEHLIGIIDGIVADDQLHDREVLFLQTWLADNPSVAETWPGAAVTRAIRESLADGVITAAEREHLILILRQLATCDFGGSGSVSPEVCQLPIDDSVTVRLMNAGVCHSGTFAFGTRAAVERATSRVGGMPTSTVSRRTDYLVIGTMVSPGWKNTTFGRKIEKAVALQDDGHEIEIISEQRWLVALGAAIDQAT